MTVWCEFARYNRYNGILELRDNVKMQDPQRILFADRVTYYRDNRRTVVENNVRVFRDSVWLSCKRGRYEESIETTEFNRDMLIEDLRRNITLTGEQGIWENGRERGKVPMNPVLTRYNKDGVEEAKIVSREMHYDSQVGFAEARKKVKITFGEVEGTCRNLYYYPDSSKALMLGDPVVFRNRDEARGDTIWLYLEKDKLDSVEVFGNAIAFTPADTTESSPRSKMTGRRIVMDFDEKVVLRMESQIEATALYHIYEGNENKGSNQVSGDRIVLFLKDQKLDHIVVEGGTQGTYFPERLTGRFRRDE